jgi:hypothetical protein
MLPTVIATSPLFFTVRSAVTTVKRINDFDIIFAMKHLSKISKNYFLLKEFELLFALEKLIVFEIFLVIMLHMVNVGTFTKI